MFAWFIFLIYVSAGLLLVSSLATPIQNLSMELQNNRTTHGLQAEGYTNSIQIMLDRESYRDYYWELFVGPYGKKANPCGTNHKPFRLAAMSGVFGYGRNDIDHPPNPPAMELSFVDNSKNECKWKTDGGGDPGQLICGDWMIMDCERDASWNDGAINCHGFSTAPANTKMLFSLFIGIVAFLLGTASAYPTEDPVTQVPGNDTKTPSDFYDASIQVLLNRASGTEYYWEMFQGPSG
ncbi:unnamed protein product [Alternaria alternata]